MVVTCIGAGEPEPSMTRVKELAALDPESLHKLVRFSWDRVNWGNFLGLGVLHVICLAAPFTFSWSSFTVAAVLYWLIGCFGVTMGYHRLLTHRSFETVRPFEYLLATLGTMAWQGGPVRWVGTHRMHHREADTDLDPHSPRNGFSWSHVLWCCTHDALGRDMRTYAPDLARDPFMRWLDRFHVVPQLLLGSLLYGLGGWAWVVWGIAVRTVFSYHATWLVNSASHVWGYRNFVTPEDSRNNWFVALLAWGEGWHNNHHAYQRSARHGMRWFEIDITFWTIRLLSFVGITRNLVIPKVTFDREIGDT